MFDNVQFHRRKRSGTWYIQAPGWFVCWHAGIRGLWGVQHHAQGYWSLVMWRLEIAKTPVYPGNGSEG